MQNRNDEPRLQHAPLRLPRKDDGRGRVNRRAMGVGRVSEWRKVTSQKPGGNFRQPQSEAEDRTIWPCRDHERRSSYHRRIFFEVAPLQMTQPIVKMRSVASDIRMRGPRHLKALRAAKASCRASGSIKGQAMEPTFPDEPSTLRWPHLV